MTICTSDIFTLVIYILLKPSLGILHDHSWPFSAHLLNKVIDMSWVIGLFSEDVGTGCYSLQENIPLLAFTNLNTLLDYVITISVLHHLVENPILGKTGIFIVIWIEELFDQILLILIVSILKTLFDNITSELVITELDYLSLDALNNFILVLLTFTMFKHMLNHIVPKLILSERMNLTQNLI